MPFDASQLWWPPHQKLHDSLEALRLDGGAATAMPPGLAKALGEQSGWLAQLLNRFKRPSEASGRALETEPVLTVGAKKIVVEAPLRKLALEVSSALVSVA